VHIQTTTLQTKNQIILTFTDKPITAWGGLSLVAGYSAHIRLAETLKEHLSLGITSPNATAPVDVVLAFIAGVLVGARRFAHIETLRHDEVIKRLLGVKRFPSDATMTRFFRRFKQKELYEIFEPLRAWQIRQLTPPGNYTLDLDSSVFERYGKQEGAVLGYNPKKHRRPSHHPLIATLAENHVIAHSWLRSGNTASITGAVEFFAEAIAGLPPGAVVDVVRGDSGFDSGRFFDYLETEGLRYAVCARFTGGVKRAVAGVKEWRELDSDVLSGGNNFPGEKLGQEQAAGSYSPAQS